MKTLYFSVTVGMLPDQVEDYRVQGSVCHGAARELLSVYGGQVMVNVSSASPPASLEEAGLLEPEPREGA